MTFLRVLFFILCSLTPIAFAQSEGGSGTVGGGERIGSYLRDLVSQGTCKVQSGHAFARQRARRTRSILKRLESTHWFLAEQLREAIDRLRICEVQGELQPIATDDEDAFVHFDENAKMVAIRTFGEAEDYVFVSSRDFRQLNSDSKAYLLIHEAMHSFIGRYVSRRNEKVRNSVAAIRTAVVTPMNEFDFQLQLEFSAIHTVLRASSVQSLRAPIRTLLNPRASEAELLAAYATVGMLPDGTWPYADMLPAVAEALDRIRELDVVRLRASLLRGDFVHAEQSIRRLGPNALSIRVSDSTGDRTLLERTVLQGQAQTLRWLATLPGVSTCAVAHNDACPPHTNAIEYARLLTLALRNHDDDTFEAVVALPEFAIPEDQSAYLSPLTLSWIAGKAALPRPLREKKETLFASNDRIDYGIFTETLLQGSERMLRTLVSHPLVHKILTQPKEPRTTLQRPFPTQWAANRARSLQYRTRGAQNVEEEARASEMANSISLSFVDLALLRGEKSRITMLVDAGLQCRELCPHLLPPVASPSLPLCGTPTQVLQQMALGDSCLSTTGARLELTFNLDSGYGWIDPSGTFWPMALVELGGNRLDPSELPGEVCRKSGSTLVSIEDWRTAVKQYGIDQLLPGTYGDDGSPDFGFFALNEQWRPDVFVGAGAKASSTPLYHRTTDGEFIYLVRCKR